MEWIVNRRYSPGIDDGWWCVLVRETHPTIRKLILFLIVISWIPVEFFRTYSVLLKTMSLNICSLFRPRFITWYQVYSIKCQEKTIPYSWFHSHLKLHYDVKWQCTGERRIMKVNYLESIHIALSKIFYAISKKSSSELTSWFNGYSGTFSAIATNARPIETHQTGWYFLFAFPCQYPS